MGGEHGTGCTVPPPLLLLVPPADFRNMPMNAILNDGSIDLVGRIKDIAQYVCDKVGCEPVTALQ